MPAKKTGTPANARAILREYGETVTLADGSTVMGVHRQRTDEFELEVGSQIREYNVLWVPTDSVGTLDVGQDVVIDGESYLVGTMNADSDGWTKCSLGEDADDADEEVL